MGRVDTERIFAGLFALDYRPQTLSKSDYQLAFILSFKNKTPGAAIKATPGVQKIT